MEKLRKIVAKALQMPLQEITDDLKRGDGNWDSFNHLMLIAEVETALGISFSLDEPGRVGSFRDLAAFVGEKMGRGDTDR
jgi:acyl carrier protein